MRLLLRLGHVRAATELDRAFFTARPGTSTTQEEEEVGRDDDTASRAMRRNGFAVGPGIALERGNVRIAWMQSLAVRLQAGNLGETQAQELGHLLSEMRRGIRGQALSPLVLAFIGRKLDLLHLRLEGQGKAKRAARRQVQHILRSIREAESNGEATVSLALLDGAVEKLERQVTGKVDMALYGQVEREIETLIGTLDGPLNEDLFAFSELHCRLPDPESVDQHSHILYLAIRFLLFRARHASRTNHVSNRSPAFGPPETLSSASQLYSLLLDLTPSVSHLKPELSHLRQRQSSALYRLLWAHLRILDTHRSFSGHPSVTSSTSSPFVDVPSAPVDGPAVIAAAYDLIELTLESTSTLRSPCATPHLPSHIPQDPRLVGVSTRFHRQALELLSLSAAPSRRELDQPFPPWSTFERAFDVIARQRENDSRCASPALDVVEPARPEWARDLVVQPAFAIHLLRATLLGSGDLSLSHESTTERGSPTTRLGQLVDLITRLERSGPQQQRGRDRHVVERRARALFKKAVDVVVESEWKGVGTAGWRELIRSKIHMWADEKRSNRT